MNDLIIPAYMERYLTLRDANDSIMEYYLYIGAEVELRDFFYYGGYLHLNALPIIHRLPFNFYCGYMYLLEHYQRDVTPTNFLTTALDNILRDIDGNEPVDVVTVSTENDEPLDVAPEPTGNAESLDVASQSTGDEKPVNVAPMPTEDDEARWLDFDTMFDDLFADIRNGESFEFANLDEALDYSVSPIRELGVDYAPPSPPYAPIPGDEVVASNPEPPNMDCEPTGPATE